MRTDFVQVCEQFGCAAVFLISSNFRARGSGNVVYGHILCFLKLHCNLDWQAVCSWQNIGLAMSMCSQEQNDWSVYLQPLVPNVSVPSGNSTVDVSITEPWELSMFLKQAIQRRSGSLNNSCDVLIVVIDIMFQLPSLTRTIKYATRKIKI